MASIYRVAYNRILVPLQADARSFRYDHMTVFDLYDWTNTEPVFDPDYYLYSWGIDATGAGLVQAYDAIDAVP